ncbi:MAG: YbaB/EbfC family nucleoid-associated protein [Candidatus Aureabacteria bacterium]|nr:YbaB/EbfC family nucleoid-associated protein [Candidatus Auribacterota bacterium]
MADIFGMLKQAHALKKEMGKMGELLARVDAEGVSGSGLVRVSMDGQMRVTRVSIDPACVARGDARALEQMVLQAMNAAREKAQALAAQEMKKIVGDIPLPM